VDDLVMNESDGQQNVRRLRGLVERTAPFIEHGTFSNGQLISCFCYRNTVKYGALFYSIFCTRPISSLHFLF